VKTKAIAAQEIDTESRVGAYGIGTDGVMYYKIWNGSASLPTKTGWLSLSGIFDSIPSTFAHRFELSPWTTEVFGLGSNSAMFHRTASHKPQSRAVHSVINFYLHFVEEPPGELRAPPHTAFS
jgi:hypothetical protein